MKTWVMAVVAAPLALTAVAAAAAEKMIGFTVGGTSLKMPLPAGYCEPTGELADFSDKIDALDKDNYTPITLVRCEKAGSRGAFEDYILIKSPKVAARSTFEKASGLAQLDQAVRQMNASGINETTADKFADDSERELGARIELEGKFGYAGRDQDCVYLAGPVAGSVNGTTVKGLVASCLTIAGGKLVSVNVYEMPAKTNIAAMKVRARSIAVSIQP